MVNTIDESAIQIENQCAHSRILSGLRRLCPLACDMPRKSVPSRSRGFGLRGRVMAGNSGSFRTPQTQVSGSSELPIAGFLSPSGFGSGRSAAVSTHRAANVSGGWSAKALCGRTWL